MNTVQAVGDGRYMLTEAGPKPRLLEVDRDGKVVVEVPLQAQTKDHHLQTRMARKLPNGNYLVPQLLDKVVREYTPDGQGRLGSQDARRAAGELAVHGDPPAERQHARRPARTASRSSSSTRTGRSSGS